MAHVTNNYDCCQINCPDWYERPDFVRWATRPGIANWHGQFGEARLQDVFTWIEFAPDGHAEGSDIGGGEDEALPDDILAELLALLKAAGFRAGLVWLTNLSE
jgi:hypothetical protein